MKTISFIYCSAFIFFPSWLSQALWNIAGKYKKGKKTVEKLKLPLAWAVLMHVLHRTRVKVVEEEWRVKPLWIRCFISPAVYIFHPVPPSPRLSPLWFFFLFLLLAERADCAALGECSKRACVLCIVPFFLNMMRKAWNNNVWGRRERPLCSLFHLLSLFLCSCFSRWQWCALQISCRCEPFDPLWDKLHIHACVHTPTHHNMYVYNARVGMYTPKHSHKGSLHEYENEIGSSLPNTACSVFSIRSVKTWKKPC